MIVFFRLIVLVWGFFLFNVFMPINISARALYSNFSIEMPLDWQVKEDKEVVSFIHPDALCIVDVMVLAHQGMPFREYVISMYQSLQAKNAKNIDNGINFDVTNEANIPSKVRLSRKGKYFVAMTVSGDCAPYQKNIASIAIMDANGRAMSTGGRVYPKLKEQLKSIPKK